MAEPTAGKINQLLSAVPEGLLVDAAWLSRRGYSTALRTHYVHAGWLEQPARRVYRRPRGPLRWEQVVISIQSLLRLPFLLGGPTALELQGFSHYLSPELRDVHLYGPKPLPSWAYDLELPVRFHYHNSQRLFRGDPASQAPTDPAPIGERSITDDFIPGSAKAMPWGHWEWPLIVSTPERALLELLDEVPTHQSFHTVDKIMEGMTSLSPTRLATLLRNCTNVKVKRLFFYFAARSPHPWARRLHANEFDLGSGKRLLVRGGKLDPQFQITVPGDLDGDA